MAKNDEYTQTMKITRSLWCRYCGGFASKEMCCSECMNTALTELLDPAREAFRRQFIRRPKR